MVPWFKATAQGSDIPDSGDLQWYIDENSGTTLNPSVGSVTATVNGGTWTSETGTVGDVYLSNDGTDDDWQTDSAIDIQQTQATVFGWLKPQEYSNFGVTVCQSNPDVGSTDDGWIIGTEDTTDLLTWMGDGTDTISVLRNVPFVPTGTWGFFAFLLDGDNHRLITFDNSSELADESADTSPSDFSPITPSNTTTEFLAANGRWGFHQAGHDFWGVAEGRLLSKSEITDLWEATKR